MPVAGSAARLATVDCASVTTDRLRALARDALHLCERTLHPWRRRAVRRRLERAPRPRTLLFVCHANICRSPYAAAAARRLPPLSAVTVQSAGFVGPDRASPAEAVAVAAERGIDLAAHRSQVIGLAQLHAADLVFVMDRQQRRRLVSGRPGLRHRIELLGDLDPEPIRQRAVLDPFRQPADVFRACYDRIDRCVAALAHAGRERDDTQAAGPAPGDPGPATGGPGVNATTLG
jgi:protein-tyrosine phosphatase